MLNDIGFEWLLLWSHFFSRQAKVFLAEKVFNVLLIQSWFEYLIDEILKKFTRNCWILARFWQCSDEIVNVRKSTDVFDHVLLKIQTILNISIVLTLRALPALGHNLARCLTSCAAWNHILYHCDVNQMLIFWVGNWFLAAKKCLVVVGWVMACRSGCS